MSYFNASFQTPQGGDVKLLDTDGSASVSLKANDTTTSYTLKFPAAVGTSGQVLKLADGSGGLEFANEAASSINADDIAAGDAPVSITTNNGDITIQASTSNAIILNDGSNNVVTVQSDVVTVTGNITMDAANSIQFRDSALSINSSADGQLDIDADTTLQITAPTVDIDASTEVNVSGALTIGGAVNIDDTTTSTTEATGALVVDGGVGIGENLNIAGITNIIDTTEATATNSASLKTAGGLGVAKDIYAGNDIYLDSDAAVLNFGADNDVSLTHVADTGLLLNGASALQFRDSALSINSSADGQLDIDADTTVQITTATLDIDATTEVNVSNDLTVGGDMIVTGDLTVNGTTTTVNSNVTTIDDPVIELGTAGATELTLDRGIKYHYYDSTAKIGFFGLDRSASVFTFYSDATFASNTNIVSSGTLGGGRFNSLTANATTASTSVDTGALVSNGGLGVAGDIYVGDDVYLASDAAVLNFGADNDVTLTHVADTGLLLNSTSALQFRDSALSISSTADGQLDIDADTTLQITAPTVDIDASTEVNVSNDLTIGGNLSMTNTFTVGVDSITTTTTNAAIISASLNASIKSFKLNSPTALTYNCPLGDNSGQMLHLFYDNLNTAGSANIDFGIDSLYVGSGTARYLKFTQTGQSATLVYIDGTDANSTGWRIINTGATIS